MRSLVNVFGPTEPQFGPRQVIHLFSGIRVWSSHTIRNLDAVITSRFDDFYDKGDNDQLRLQELEALDKKQLQAQQHIELYQAQILKAFNKKVK